MRSKWWVPFLALSAMAYNCGGSCGFDPRGRWGGGVLLPRYVAIHSPEPAFAVDDALVLDDADFDPAAEGDFKWTGYPAVRILWDGVVRESADRTRRYYPSLGASLTPDEADRLIQERLDAAATEERQSLQGALERGTPAAFFEAGSRGTIEMSVTANGTTGVKKIQAFSVPDRLFFEASASSIDVGASTTLTAVASRQSGDPIDDVGLSVGVSDGAVASVDASSVTTDGGSAGVTVTCDASGDVVIEITIATIGDDLPVRPSHRLSSTRQLTCASPAQLPIGYSIVDFATQTGFLGAIGRETGDNVGIFERAGREVINGMPANSFAYVDQPWGNPSGGDLWLAGDDGSNPRNLTNHPAFYRRGSASPDGARLVFESDRERPGQCFNPCDVFMINTDGTGLQKILSDASLPHFTPNGRVVYSTDADQDGLFEVRIANADGSGAALLIDDDDQNQWWFGEAAVSPDGTRLAVTRTSFTTGASAILVGGFDGASVTNLVVIASEVGAGSFGNFNPWWSPDGTEIVFTSDRTGDQEIWVMKSDGSNPENLTNSPATVDFNPFWAVP